MERVARGLATLIASGSAGTHAAHLPVGGHARRGDIPAHVRRWPRRPRVDGAATAVRRAGRVCGWLLALGWAIAPAAARDASAPSKVRPGVENRNRLWALVHDGCVPAAARNRYPPFPCVEVDTATHGGAAGYAVLKDRAGRYQYLVLPLARVRGIESPALQAPGAPNYFADAWTARAHGLGEPCTARLAHETLEGIAEGLDADGALRLRLASGEIRRITAGDVFFGSA